MKKYLLDTCSFLWAAANDSALSSKAKKIISAQDTLLLVSSASVWEMAIKISHKKLTLPLPLSDYIADKARAENIEMLPVLWQHSCFVSDMAFHHTDPFDRLLIAQAIEEKIPVITPDVVFKKYSVHVVW